jgi:DNA-binding XRE family transcriptional regulator
MKAAQLAAIREHLEKTQEQMGQILGVSRKAIQSFEQGWRDVPLHIERQVLLILALKSRGSKATQPCWMTRPCRAEEKENCPAWQFDAGNICWFINGTLCEGKAQGSWEKKMQVCRDCEVYKSMLDLKG